MRTRPRGDHRSTRPTRFLSWPTGESHTGGLTCKAGAVIDTDSLWGNQLTTLHLHPVVWTIRGDATLSVDGVPQVATLRLEDVSDVQIHGSVPLDWDYAELTEIYVTATETGLDVQLILWVEETRVLVRCTRLSVTTTI